MYLVFGYFSLTPVGAFPLGAMMSGPESSTPAGQRLPRKDDNDDDSNNNDHHDDYDNSHDDYYHAYNLVDDKNHDDVQQLKSQGRSKLTANS